MQDPHPEIFSPKLGTAASCGSGKTVDAPPKSARFSREKRARVSRYGTWPGRSESAPDGEEISRVETGSSNNELITAGKRCSQIPRICIDAWRAFLVWERQNASRIRIRLETFHTIFQNWETPAISVNHLTEQKEEYGKLETGNIRIPRLVNRHI